jgi:hypothetical protein
MGELIMVDYMSAIKKPFSDLKTLGIGAVLGAIPVVNLLVSGYAVKTAEDVISKKNNLRKWALNDIVEYIIKLVMALIIGIVYMIIPGIVIAVGVGGAILTGLASYAADPSALTTTLMSSLAVGAPIILVGVLLALIAAFLTPVAIMKWLKSGSIMSAFGLLTVIKSALTIDYIVTLIVVIIYAIVLMIIAGIITLILAIIPVIGALLGMIVMGGVSFALAVTEYTLIAQVVK